MLATDIFSAIQGFDEKSCWPIVIGSNRPDYSCGTQQNTWNALLTFYFITNSPALVTSLSLSLSLSHIPSYSFAYTLRYVALCNF